MAPAFLHSRGNATRLRSILAACLLASAGLAGCASGCFIEGTRSFDLGTSAAPDVAMDITLSVARDGREVLNRTLVATSSYTRVASFDDEGDHVLRGSTVSGFGEERFRFERCGGTAGVTFFVARDGSLQAARAVM